MFLIKIIPSQVSIIFWFMGFFYACFNTQQVKNKAKKQQKKFNYHKK